ncbi:hypothetical protein BDV97DRAFT_57310 [Delphinella strobiligena]|nr:hypothetical protein BDV97DRAFT_57310 [Delphinella strobiligena]
MRKRWQKPARPPRWTNWTQSTSMSNQHNDELAGLNDDLESKNSIAVQTREARSQENILQAVEAQREWARQLEKTGEQHRAELETALADARASAEVAVAEKEARYVEESEKAGESRQEAERLLEEVEMKHKMILETTKQTTERRLAEVPQNYEKSLVDIRSAAELLTSAKLAELENLHQSALSDALANAHLQAAEDSTILAERHESEIRNLREVSDANLLATREKLDLLGSMNTQLDSEKKIMAAENVMLSAQLEEKQKQANEREQAITEQLHVATQNAQDGKLRVESLTASLASVEEKLTEINSTHTLTLSGMNEQLEAVTSEMSSTLAERLELLSQLEALQRDYIDTSSARDSLASQLAFAEEERQKSAESVLELLSDREEHIREREVLTSKMNELHIELEQSKGLQAAEGDADLQRKLKDLQTKLENALAENASLRTQQQDTWMNREMTEHNRIAHSTGEHRSFEEYLDQAQSELSELGRVITHNESLFAAKIQQHVGEMQHAKDQLAREYKEKFDALVAQRAQLEDHAQSQQATELEAARETLRGNYERSNTDSNHRTNPPELSNRPHEDFHEADSRLVVEHRRELTNKKSKIAIRHAFEFQQLSDEYDRQIAQLTGDKNKLQSDLSIEPARYERLAGELDAISEQLASERPRSGSPMSYRRISSPTSLRRVPGSDSVRSVSPTDSMRRFGRTPEGARSPREGMRYSRTRHRSVEPTKMQTQKQHRTPIKATTSTRLSTPSAGTASINGGRSPSRVMSTPRTPRTPGGNARTDSDGPVPRRTVERPRTSEKWVSPADAKKNDAIDFGVDPLDFERRRKSTQASQAVEAAKFAVMAAMSRTSSSSGVRPGTAGSSSGSSSARPGSSQQTRPGSSQARPGSSGKMQGMYLGEPNSPRMTRTASSQARPGSSSKMQGMQTGEAASPRSHRYAGGGTRAGR